MLIVLGILYDAFMFGYTISGLYTVVSHANVFCNLGSVTILVYKLITR